MDTSNNTLNDEYPDDLPDLIPIEPNNSPTSPLFAHFLNRITQQMPYTMNLNTLIVNTGQIPIMSPIALSHYISPPFSLPSNNSVISHTMTPDISAGLFTTTTFPRNMLGPANSLSAIMEQSFQEKLRYKEVLSEEGVKQIIYTTYSKGDGGGDICAITREEFAEGDDIAILPCKHVFCREAITHWLETKKAECPICRFKLKAKEVREETENIEERQQRVVPRLHNMRQMIVNLINNSIDAEEDQAIQQAIIASLRDN